MARIAGLCVLVLALCGCVFAASGPVPLVMWHGMGEYLCRMDDNISVYITGIHNIVPALFIYGVVEYFHVCVLNAVLYVIYCKG